jgi:hypothetical protein
VVSGEEIKIHIEEITDRQGRGSQSWQQVLVRAEKGEILNGKEEDVWRLFDVGDGTIELDYKAPEECRKEHERIIVKNTCDIGEWKVTEENKIEEKEFNIICLEMELRWSGGCVSFGQQVTCFSLPVNTKEDPHKVEWEGKVSKSCSWNDEGYRCSISNRAKFRIEGKIVPESEESEKLTLAFEWQGSELVVFERFKTKETNPLTGKILIDIPLQPGDYAITLIEGAKNVKVPTLKIKTNKQNKGKDSYNIGNWAVLHIRV